MESESCEIMMEETEEDGEIQEPTASAAIDIKRERNSSGSLSHSFTLLDEEKLKKRAERFGVDPDATKVKLLTKDQLQELYSSLELPEEEVRHILEDTGLDSHALNHRFEALHLRGTEDMSTQDVFDYFKGYAPASIEWINDYSCNVVWFEPWQAAHAMLERSTRVIKSTPTKHIETEDMDHETMEETADNETAIPPIPTPPGVWRLGFEYPKATALLMRFATRSDRKMKGAERLSKFYCKYGNPNYGGIKGLISTSRKRRLRGKETPPIETDSKNPWGSLAEAWGASETEETWQPLEIKRMPGSGLPSALVRRLGHQPPRPSPSRSRDTASEESDFDSDSGSQSSYSSESSNQGQSQKKRPRMRMYADEEEEKARRNRKSLEMSKDVDDFGSKLAKLRTSRPVHSRLGPNVDSSPTKSNAVTKTKSIGDLRQRLGSSGGAKPTISSMVLKVGSRALDDRRNDDDDDDEEEEDDQVQQSSYMAVDLRNKLQGRLGAK